MTTIEAKDAQPGVVYKNARGMMATLVAGLRFRAPSGAEFELEPDTELTEAEHVTDPEQVAPAWCPEIGDWVILVAHPELPMCVIRPTPEHPSIAARHPDGCITSELLASELRSAPLRSAAPSAEVPVAPKPQAANAPAEGKVARPRCVCAECGEEVSLVKGEVARKHWRGARTDENVCPGSGRPPKKAEPEVGPAPEAKVEPWQPQVGDRVTTTETQEEVAVVAAIDPGDPDGAYQLRWETGEVTCGWPLVELRPVAGVMPPEAEPVVAAPSPGDTFQVQEGADSPTLEEVCAAMSSLEDEQEEPSEDVRRLFSDDLDPTEGEPLAFSVPPEREETMAGFIGGIPRLVDEPETATGLYYGIPPGLTSTIFTFVDPIQFEVSVEGVPAAVPEDEYSWLDCHTHPPDDQEDVIAETWQGNRHMARVRVEDHGLVFIDSGEFRGARVKRWKPWKKAQPDQAAEIARLTAEVATAKSDAAADARECAEAKEMLRSVLWTLTEIGIAVAVTEVTTESAQRQLSVPQNRAQLVRRVKLLVDENVSLRRHADMGDDADRTLQEQAGKTFDLEELVGNLRAQLAAAEEKVARYHKAARRSARATLAALGDEP